MYVPRTAKFDEQRRKFGLCFTCEDCAYFDHSAAMCSHEWPTEEHRQAFYESPLEPGDVKMVIFCKEFELL